MPDPHCASCGGDFVEKVHCIGASTILRLIWFSVKMEDPSDDPREFQHSLPGAMDAENYPAGMDNFLGLPIRSFSGYLPADNTPLIVVRLQSMMDGRTVNSSASPTQAAERPGMVSFTSHRIRYSTAQRAYIGLGLCNS
jgi:hypothetical protein